MDALNIQLKCNKREDQAIPLIFLQPWTTTTFKFLEKRAVAKNKNKNKKKMLQEKKKRTDMISVQRAYSK